MAQAPAQDRFTVQDYYTPGPRGRLRRFPHLVRLSLGIVRESAPRELTICTTLQIASGIGIAVQLLLLRSLLTEMFSGRVEFSAVLPEVIALTVLSGLIAAATVALDAEQRLLGQLTALHTTDQLIATTARLDLITYDSPEFHDRLQRAQLSAGQRPAQMVQGLLGVLGASFAIAGVLVALVLIEPVFSVLVLVAFVPAWIATNRAARFIYRHTVEQTERERQRVYIFDVLTNKREAQEVRAFDLGGFLGDRHRRIYTRLIAELRTVLRRRLRVSLAGQLVTAFLTGAILGVLVWLVSENRMSLSEAGAAAGAIVLLTGRLRALSSSAGGLYESSLYLEDYSSFVASRPRIEAARPTRQPDGDPQVIAAEEVSFTYPSRSQPSLVDASLTLRRGEVVALVGENGSGKTTFAKLLAGLYSPESGRVTWDGQDTDELDPVSVRARVAVIFQDFARYLLSAHDNVALGDHRQFDDAAAIERAAKEAGIHDTFAALQEGYATLLGPEYFGGSDLSGGQWQRVALARAFLRDAPLVILDEPTASLDPRAEADLYANMRELFAGRGVLLISHRFGSVRTADRIYVLRDGRVYESGSHQELMDDDGYYAELFRLQASAFVH